MRRISRSDRQLDLALASADEMEWVRCRGIFSLSYLKGHLTGSSGLPGEEDASATYERVRALWKANRVGLSKGNEAYTKTRFLEPLFRELGWAFVPEQRLPAGMGTRKQPDYCLFVDEQTAQQAAEQDSPVDILRLASTVLEAKQLSRHLDRESREDTPGWFPSDQIQDYLRHATDSSGQRFFDWAILTNGRQWRLYCEKAAPDAYFELQLVDKENVTFCPPEVFRFFLRLFHQRAFLRTDGVCLLDEVRGDSYSLQTQLETDLRQRIFDVLEELATAFRANPDNHITEAEYPALYRNALIWLYRVLFVLYAESRDLLPAKPRGPGANAIYRERYSLTRFKAKLRDKTSFPSDAFTDIYDELTKLFRLINGQDKRKNEACGVPRYNGGLFDPRKHPLLETWKVGDKSLADVLRQLIFAQPPARSSVRQQRIATEETIDYGTLEVRQLGDIYEGLLGAQLRDANGRLELQDEGGENHRHGIIYTPDWVVAYLVREALQPLLDAIEQSPAVQTALRAERREGSFARAALRLNVLDPAMGSGHLLVRATEYLADRIRRHPTTPLMTGQVVAHGERKQSRAEIETSARVPVSPGLSQEDAEKAYWRRRVVEACIYGVDTNELAVELAKLSLWLTCIAADRPLSFLDHHLRCGNSLLFARPDELGHSPSATEDERKQPTMVFQNALPKALASAIATNMAIEDKESAEKEDVENKERQWQRVRSELAPFVKVADLWLAVLAGEPVNDLDYRLFACGAIAPEQVAPKDKADAKRIGKALTKVAVERRETLNPFHWHLEFPDVFFNPDGTLRSAEERGFDAIFGNPPYISTHTSMAETWRKALACRAGFMEDLYVHFADLGFQLLRPGGTFGFIVSDTFFTLASKLRMRELLQDNTLTHLGQCDPFDATVDAAIFVARRGSAPDGHRLMFIQARPRKVDGKSTQPEKELPMLPPADQLQWEACGDTQHTAFKSLRLHRLPLATYRQAHKRVFFEPRPATLQFFERFNAPVKRLHAEWWDRIETSQKFADNIEVIRAYHRTLKPGDITLVGLIAEGGQGMRTANNARFIGYLDGTPQAEAIENKRKEWTDDWLKDLKIGPVFKELLTKAGGNAAKPTDDSAAWESCVEPLKQKFKLNDLGLTKSDLYRVVPRELVADRADFDFAWQCRKAELLSHWQSAKELVPFWTEGHLAIGRRDIGQLRMAKTILDEDFCALCQLLQQWVEEQRKAKKKISREALGLRSSENYADPADAPRIATIYNGLSGRGLFVPFRKGDPEGNRWVDNEPLYINWRSAEVIWLFEHSGRPEPNMPVMRNAHLYFTPGVTWTAVANHVAMKARFQEPCVFDADSMRLTPEKRVLDPLAFLALLNSDVLSFFKMKFIKHTQKWEIGDLRQLPITMPGKSQEKRLAQLAERAIEAKRLSFTNGVPSNELAGWLRELAGDLSARAPEYLRPPAQQRLLATPADCLAIIELAVNWEAEKLYGVEGLGPFDEF